MQKKMMPNYQGSLSDYKNSMNQPPSPSYPEGFTPGPYVGFTPGASVPKAGGKSKPMPKRKGGSSKEDPSTVRKMQDRLVVVRQKFQEDFEDKNYYDQGGLMKLGSEIDKLQRGIEANSNSRETVAKKPGKPKGKPRRQP
jgi:hypothetical protein